MRRATHERSQPQHEYDSKEVGLTHTSDEEGEQGTFGFCGVLGAKGWDQRELNSAKASCRTQCRERVLQAAEGVRLAARRKEGQMTALLHHISVDALMVAYLNLKREASAGLDRVTWREYGENLEENLN